MVNGIGNGQFSAALSMTENQPPERVLDLLPVHELFFATTISSIGTTLKISGVYSSQLTVEGTGFFD